MEERPDCQEKEGFWPTHSYPLWPKFFASKLLFNCLPLLFSWRTEPSRLEAAATAWSPMKWLCTLVDSTDNALERSQPLDSRGQRKVEAAVLTSLGCSFWVLQLKGGVPGNLALVPCATFFRHFLRKLKVFANSVSEWGCRGFLGICVLTTTHDS